MIARLACASRDSARRIATGSSGAARSSITPTLPGSGRNKVCSMISSGSAMPSRRRRTSVSSPEPSAASACIENPVQLRPGSQSTTICSGGALPRRNSKATCGAVGDSSVVRSSRVWRCTLCITSDGTLTLLCQGSSSPRFGLGRSTAPEDGVAEDMDRAVPARVGVRQWLS